MMRRITGTIVIHQMLAGALMRPINTFAADEGSNTNLLIARKVVTQVVTFLKNAELPPAPDYFSFVLDYEKK